MLPSKQPFGLDITSLKISPENEKKIIEVFLKFAFHIDSVTINLFMSPNAGLATFGLECFSLNGQNLVDGSISTSIVLRDMILDDKRPDRENKITRFIEQKVKDSSQPMVDVTFRMKENDIFGNLNINWRILF
jgi:vacuolar protein sorting-associated protein 13A/C